MKKRGFTLAVIPARGGSKGLKNKNILPFLGRPLIEHAIKCGLACPSIDKVIVSTDSRKIAQIARKNGADVPFLRPAYLARDNSAMLGVLQHAIVKCERYYAQKIQTLVILDPTSPLRTRDDIEASMLKFLREDCDAVISGCPASHNPYFNMVVIKNGFVRLAIAAKKRYVRRQDCPQVYDLDTTVWIYTRKAIMIEKKIIPARTKLYLIDENKSVHIDSKKDFFIAEQLKQWLDTKNV